MPRSRYRIKTWRIESCKFVTLVESTRCGAAGGSTIHTEELTDRQAGNGLYSVLCKDLESILQKEQYRQDANPNPDCCLGANGPLNTNR